jgi:arylsulfatase A-like enzyme
MQSVHGPQEVPQRFIDLYGQEGTPHFIADHARRTHQGMVTALDEALGNVTASLKATRLWENTFFWFTSDNGGPLPSSNNAPLRGGKFTNWEGGTRTRAFVHSPNQALLPAARAGTQYSGLLHVTDIYLTLLSIAGLANQSGSTGTLILGAAPCHRHLFHPPPYRRAQG